MNKTAEFDKMVAYLREQGAEVDHLVPYERAAETETFTEMSDEQLAAYHATLVACIEHPPRFASRQAMIEEAFAVSDELVNRGVES